MTASLVTFLVAILILTMTPGFDTALILRTSAASGWKKALATSMGVNAGCMAWGAAVGLGLGALLLASEIAYNALRLVGAAYLLWLGVGLLLKPRSAPHGELPATRQQSSYRSVFMRGFLGNMLNPKVGIFYVSFLPQFIPAGSPVALWSVGLAFVHVLVGTLWNGMLIACTQYFAEKLRQPAVMKMMDRLTGCVFIGFAAKLALSRR